MGPVALAHWPTKRGPGPPEASRVHNSDRPLKDRTGSSGMRFKASRSGPALTNIRQGDCSHARPRGWLRTVISTGWRPARTLPPLSRADVDGISIKTPAVQIWTICVPESSHENGVLSYCAFPLCARVGFLRITMARRELHLDTYQRRRPRRGPRAATGAFPRSEAWVPEGSVLQEAGPRLPRSPHPHLPGHRDER